MDIVVRPPRNIKSLYQIIDKYCPPGWEHILRIELLDEIKKIESIIHAKFGPVYYPRPYQVFRAFELIRFEDIKVMILGQDPYPGIDKDGNPLATGLAFSVREGIPPPESLKNIFKEIKSNTGIQNTSGDLTYWAKQGVLLLNTCLTIGENNISHKNIWIGLVNKVLTELVYNKKQTIFVLWGREAKAYKDRLSGCHVLEAAHPSPLSASRGFFGCEHFSLINIRLMSIGQSPIDWRTGTLPDGNHNNIVGSLTGKHYSDNQQENSYGGQDDDED